MAAGKPVVSTSIHDVVRPYARAQAVCDVEEQTVADLVSEAVVHQLEPVEVEEDDGDGRIPACRTLQRVRQAVVEERAVREAGELVVEGAVLEHLGTAGLGRVQAAMQHVEGRVRAHEALHRGFVRLPRVGEGGHVVPQRAESGEVLLVADDHEDDLPAFFGR